MTSTQESLIVADLQSHRLGGHFALWLNRAIEQAALNFATVDVYVADKESLPSSDVFAALSSRMRVNLIPEIHEKGRWHGDILGVISCHAAQNSQAPRAPIFLMWAQQFIEQDVIFPPRKSWMPWRKSLSFQSPWATMTSVSSVSHDPKSAPEMERRIHEMISAGKNCIGALLWDEYAVKRFGGKYCYLPDVESCEADPNWRLAEGEPITIGSVGQLWGGRSVNLLTEILDSEKGFRGYLGGVLKPDSYTKRAALLIQAREGIHVEEGFVETDGALNQRLRKLDAFVIDSRTYKCPSGLAIRAMAMGRPIISMDSPSWIANLIKEYGVGVFWREGVGSLDKELREWAASGGSDLSVAAAGRLSDNRGMKEAFGEIFDRLKQASAV